MNSFFTSQEELEFSVQKREKRKEKDAHHFQLLTQRGSTNYMDFTSFEVDPLTIKETKKMKIEEFYKILGLRGTVKILKYLNEHEKARYIDLSFIISYASLNTRLTQLETLNIIEHHFNRGKEKREEWYELTEKGKKLILIFNQLEEIVNE